MSFSNYGHPRSYLNSWGARVTTSGYGALQNLPGNNRDYTDSYNGTSSATPLCAGALALLQSYAKQRKTLITPSHFPELLHSSNYEEGIIDLIGKRINVEKVMRGIDHGILLPLANENPFPVSSGYMNYNIEFEHGTENVQRIMFDYTSSEITNTGVVAHYEEEGPPTLEWYSYGYTRITLPMVAIGGVEIVYLRAAKVNAGGTFTMNSAADLASISPGEFTLRIEFHPSDNKFLSKWKFKGILPLYVKSRNYPEYSLPLRINIKIN